jgi:hypothetical protein
MSVKEKFIEVRELLKSPDSWCKDNFAKNKDGNGVSFQSEQACKFCLLGAFHKVTDNDGYIRYDDMKREFKKIINWSTPIDILNDAETTTHYDIIKWLDKCIEECKI